MKWVRYRIRTIPQAEDLIVSGICALGLEGAQIEDNVPLTAAEKEQIYTYDAEDPVDDGVAYVSFYAALSEDGLVTLTDQEACTPQALRGRMEEVLQTLRTYGDAGDLSVDVSVTDDAEWKDQWKQYFHSFRIDDLLIRPSWEKEEADQMPADAGYVLQIDPGTAFGTGAHETTQLAIRALRARIEKAEHPRVLDIGTGSGILSILSLMFGAKKAVGVDVDPFCEDAVKQNLAVNGIDEALFSLFTGDLLTDVSLRERVFAESAGDAGEIPQGYEIVVANILPVVLTPLTKVVPSLLKKGGVYITSGILKEKEAEMKRVLTGAGWHIIGTTTQGDWCCIVSER